MQEAKENHFIKNIEIKNFKCFEDFKAEGFGRVNLIGGKNNVGKTAFMEAVYIFSDAKNRESIDFLSSFIEIEHLRGIVNTNFNGITLKNIKNKYAKSKIKINNLSIELKLKEDEAFFNPSMDFQFKKESYNFIPSYMINNDLIIFIFDEIKKQRKREKLSNILEKFDSNILEFDVIENIPQVFLNNINEFQNVEELGHGLKRYIAIISSILINKDGILFLDEIENGIHYTQLDKLWEIILTISKQQNVQVFATTHSKECIESYARVAKKLEDKEITFIDLGKNRKNEIKAIVMNSERFQEEIEMDNEVRGW